DGIRSFHVTGVQTCALPISAIRHRRNYLLLNPIPIGVNPMSKSILIVDDSMSLRATLAIALRSGGYEVTEAVDGKDALGKLDGQIGRASWREEEEERSGGQS